MLVPFPDGLPSPLLNGNSGQLGEHFRRLDVASGSPRFRLTNDRPTSIINLSWLFTTRQFNRFRSWYESPNELAFNNWFTLPVLVGDVQNFDASQGLEDGQTEFVKTTLEAHFLERYSWRRDDQSGYWIVDSVLEARYSAIVNRGLVFGIIDAGTVVSPSTDILDAGTVVSPSTDVNDGGIVEVLV